MRNQTKGLSTGIKHMLLAAAVIGIVISVCLIVLRVYRTEKISVEGLTYYTEAEFLSKISSKAARKNTLLFWLEQKKEGKQSIPYIERYDVTMQGKNGIRIQVYEKILVGCVKIMGQYLYFDKDGNVTESSAEQLSSVPLIKGLEFERIVLYEKLKIQKDELYDVILNITKLVREYALPAQSISFNGRGEVALEVDTLTVDMGKRAAYDLPIQKLADIFPAVSGRNLFIDLSGYNGEDADIIAKPKGE